MKRFLQIFCILVVVVFLLITLMERTYPVSGYTMESPLPTPDAMLAVYETQAEQGIIDVAVDYGVTLSPSTRVRDVLRAHAYTDIENMRCSTSFIDLYNVLISAGYSVSRHAIIIPICQWVEPTYIAHGITMSMYASGVFDVRNTEIGVAYAHVRDQWRAYIVVLSSIQDSTFRASSLSSESGLYLPLVKEK